MVVALTAFGRRLPIPAPLLQVLAGLAVGFVPGVSMPTLDPDVVFFVFLPPILWAAAFFTSFREFTANRWAIGGLAIGMVVATTAVVAVIARMLFLICRGRWRSRSVRSCRRQMPSPPRRWCRGYRYRAV